MKEFCGDYIGTNAFPGGHVEALNLGAIGGSRCVAWKDATVYRPGLIERVKNHVLHVDEAF